ncbi:hypothetical protein Tco_0615801 [Tanacetum coccineum]
MPSIRMIENFKDEKWMRCSDKLRHDQKLQENEAFFKNVANSETFVMTRSDDEASYHEDASENGTATNKPKQQQQQLIPTTATILNIKLPILKKEEYAIWAMEMEHYLEYIDNDVWKKLMLCVEKERKARTILLMAIPKEHLRRFHGMDDAKEI